MLLAVRVFWLPPSASSFQSSETLEAKLRAPVHNYNLTAGNFADALARVAGDFQIPIGIEWVNTPAARARLTLSWKDATVGEMVGAIVKTQRDYEMEIKNDLVHVYSSKLIPDRQNFLRLNIDRFDVNQETVEMASRKLRDSRETQGFPA